MVTLNDHLDLLNKRDKWLTEPQPFTLSQNGKEIKLQLIDYEKGLSVPGYPKTTYAFFLLAEKATPLDATQPFELNFHLKRRYGSNIVLNKVEEKLFAVDHHFHGWRASITDLRYTNWLELDWVKLWLDRQIEIGVLLIGLVLLTTGLVMQKSLSANARTLAVVRTAYLCFTLGFIGWVCARAIDSDQHHLCYCVAQFRWRTGFSIERPHQQYLVGVCLRHTAGLGTRHVLRLAVPVRCVAGTHQHGG
jgi:hypothetical protein